MPKPARLEPRQSVIVGIRPEHVIIGDGAMADVVVVEPTGSETHLSLEIEGQKIVAVTKERFHVDAGGSLAIRFDPKRLHYFDAETGLAL